MWATQLKSETAQCGLLTQDSPFTRPGLWPGEVLGHFQGFSRTQDAVFRHL